MLSIYSGVKRKLANFGPKLKVSKMKIKVCNDIFFNSSCIKRAKALILVSMKVLYTALLNSIKQAFEKQT